MFYKFFSKITFFISFLSLTTLSLLPVSGYAQAQRPDEGFVDAIHIDCSFNNGIFQRTLKVGGWTWNRDRRDLQLPVRVVYNGRDIARTVANMPRNGLPGNYAFQVIANLDSNSSNCSVKREEVEVFVDNNRQAILNKNTAVVTAASSGAAPAFSSSSLNEQILRYNYPDCYNKSDCFKIARYDYSNNSFVMNGDWRDTTCSRIIDSYYKNCQRARQQNLGDLYALQVNYSDYNTPSKEQYYQYLYYNDCPNNSCYGPSVIAPQTWYSYDRNGDLKACDSNGCDLDWYSI